MGLFNNKKIKELEKKIEELTTPEYTNIQTLKENIATLDRKRIDLNSYISNQNIEIINNINKIKQLENDIIELDETKLLQDFSLYEPRFEFKNSNEYKNKLDSIRIIQKEMIKNKTATSCNTDWTVSGSKAHGRKMTTDLTKLLLRSFNNECDICVTNVKFNNLETYSKRIIKSFESINKLGKVMKVSINDRYKDLKLEELYLAFEYQQKKQEEKEEQKRINAEIREQKKLEKEIDRSKTRTRRTGQSY